MMRLRRLWLALLLSVSFASLSFSVGLTALSDLPPRPTPSPATPAPASAPDTEPKGANLVLHTLFPEDWDFHAVHWQTPWTVIQWQDGQGEWHDVEGWRGTMDEVSLAANRVVGQKTWWVPSENLGTGPFRWVVNDGCGGSPLASSAPFTLPESSDVRQVVEIKLSTP